MKTLRLFFVKMICLFLLSSSVHAQEKFSSDEDFNNWFTYYYLHPAPERISDAIRYYCDSPMFEKSNMRMPMAAFYTALFEKNNDLMANTYKSISADGSDNSKIFLLNVLWLVNIADSKNLIGIAKSEWKAEAIQEIIERMGNRVPDDILNMPVNDPARLDILWTTFLATGNNAPVKRIISVLHLVEDGHGLDIALGGAAKWSLTSNARQHKKVYEICEEELKNSEEPTKHLLAEVIHDAKK